MKSLIKFLVLMLMTVALIPSQVHAQEEYDMPFRGIYVTEEDRAVKGYVFDGHRVYVLFDRNNYSDMQQAHRIEEMMRLARHGGARTALIDPSISADEIEERREELGLNVSLKEHLLEIAEILPDDASMEELEWHIDGRIMSIDAGYPLTDYMSTDYIKLARPEISQTDGAYVIRMMKQRLFSLSPGQEENTLVDDYEGVYRLAEDSSDAMRVMFGQAPELKE